MIRHVLCVDGDALSRNQVAETIERRLPDVTVHAVETVSGALDVRERQPVDCIVSEYRLAGTDGLAFLEAVRDDRPDLPFILFTDAGSETLASEAIAAGVTGYVQKGDTEQYQLLAKRVERAIDAYHSPPTQNDLLCEVDDATFVYDPETDDVGDVNRAVCEFWGYDYEDACECTIDDLTPAIQSATKQTVREQLRRTLDDGTRRVEWRCETDDGKEFWADVRLTVATFGSSDQVVGSIRDITAQKRREQDLQSFQEAVEHAGHSVYVTETDGEIVYVNPAFEEVTGYSAEDATGQTPAILKSGEHDDEFYGELWGTILAGDVWKNEIVNRRKDGSRYVANQTIAPITDETGDIVQFVAINAEITEQRRRERQLQRLYEATTEWLDAGSRSEVCQVVSDQLTELLEFDLHGLHLYDDSTGQLEPVAASEETERTVDELPAFEEGEGIAWEVFETGEPAYVDDVRDHPKVYNPETDIRSELALPLGEYGVLLIGAKEPGAFDHTDRTIAKVIASVLTEVLNRVEREVELERQNSRLEEFASVVSHDLRNPLSVATGHLELAIETGDDAHLEEVDVAHDRIEEIIDDLLWLAREGRQIGETRPVELSRIVNDAWNTVDTAAATLYADCDRTIEADPDRLQQLFENLFRNAVEHGSTSPPSQTNSDAVEHGEGVTVRVGLVDDGFYVEDDGPGIPESERDQVVDAGYSTTSGGTGYGLSIVQTIVDAHGWELDIADGTMEGVRFDVTRLSDD